MDIRRRFLSKKSSGGSSGGDSSGTYTVNLNSQWEKTTVVTNPDSSLYDGVYRSSSNYNVNSGVATMYITLTGYSTFKLYIRSYAESNCDYVMVSQLDKTITGSSSYSDTTLVKAHTRSNQQSGTAITSYTLVEYTGISSGSHTITIVYRKDGSVNSGDDRGYVLIPKSQGSGDSGGGDVDIDTTHAFYYTTQDNVKITASGSTIGFLANLTADVYIDGQGIMTFSSAPTKIDQEFTYSKLKTLVADGVLTLGSGNSRTFPSTFTYGVFEDVIEVKNYVFSNARNADVHFGQNITTVDNSSGISTLSIHISDLYSFSQKTVNFGTGLTTGDVNLYMDGEKISEIIVPSGVRTLGNIFMKANVDRIVLPASITSIPVYAFQQCSMSELRCEATTPPTLGSFVWSNQIKKIYVPNSSVNAYKTASG